MLSFNNIRKRRKRLLLISLVLLSLAAILTEVSGSFGVHPFGRIVLGIFSPLIKIAGALQNSTEIISASFFHRERLQKENESLREKTARMILERKALEQELNTWKKAPVKIFYGEKKEQPEYPLLPAHIIAYSPNPWARTVLIDRGTRDGIRREQTVMNDAGIVGVIQEASSDISRVHLLIDQRSAVTVRILESGEMGVIKGTGAPETLLLHTEGMSRRLRRNDHAVTAGLKRSLFPKDLLIGAVEKVERDKFGRTEAVVQPAVDFRRLDLLFILLGSEQYREKDLEDDY